MEIYAHTLKNCPDPQKWQPLDKHLQGVATFASGFAASFDSSDWAWNAAILHDFGKIDPRFQKKLFDAYGIEYKIKGKSGGVNHSNAGAAYAELRLPNGIGRTLAYLVAGHHAGLPDYFQKYTNNAAWLARKEEALDDLEQIESKIGPYISELKELNRYPAFLTKENCSSVYHLWVRMLFSCLVDADWLDTEQFMNLKRFEDRPEFPPISKLYEMFDQHMSKFDKPKAGSLNELRCEILEYCREAAKQEPGLFSLTVPTGGGKTLSGMAFALKHALEHGKKRIIYVIPYTSIIEQTANTLREIFGDKNVVEHHSNVDREKDKADKKEKEEEYTPMDLATENWDAPIIVTTNVQFFESLYAAKPRRCRKLHNIAQSVVLLDEAQLISPEYLDPCVDVIMHLTSSFNCSLVLCTATQSKPKNLLHAREIIPEPEKYYRALKRTNVRFPDDPNKKTDWEQLADKLQKHEKVLCVVNTRLDCRTLYDMVSKNDEKTTIHLSALMCGEHRSAVIANIKDRLKEKGPLRVISTQLVEAGVDIDFPVVYRAMAGLDSIVQAAGRCNREGKLEVGEVHVFVPPKNIPRSLFLLCKGVEATRSLIRQGKTDTDDPEIFKKYFDYFYKSLNDTGTKILEDLKCGKKLEIFFRHVGNTFQLIEDGCSCPIFVQYGKGKELIETLEKNGPNRDLLRKLQRYTVNLDKPRTEKYIRSGLIQKRTFFGSDVEYLVQYSDGLYTKELGLDIMKEGLSAEESII